VIFGDLHEFCVSTQDGIHEFVVREVCVTIRDGVREVCVIIGVMNSTISILCCRPYY